MSKSRDRDNTFYLWYDRKVNDEDYSFDKLVLDATIEFLGSSPEVLTSELLKTAEEFGVHCSGCGGAIVPTRESMFLFKFLVVTFFCRKCRCLC